MPAIDCKRAVEVEIPAAEVERESSRIARDLQKRARVPGFRPGKAPLTLVRQRYAATIREQVLESMLPAYLRTAFERENVEPVSQPVIEDLHFHGGEPIRFKASFEVLPEFELGDYRSVHPTPAGEPPTTVEQDIEAALGRMREEGAEYDRIEDPEAVAEAGLVAEVSYDRRIAGEAGSQHIESSRIEVGGGETLAEFSNALRGAKAGEARELEIRYPDDYGHTGVAGKTVHFDVRVKAIERKRLPPLDDAFAGRQGASDTDELRARLRQRIEAERRAQARVEADRQVAERLLKMHDFPVPEALVEQRVHGRVERQVRALAAQGIDPARLNLDWPRLGEREREHAAEDVKLALILDRVATEAKLAASDEEVEAEVARLAESLRQPLEALRRRLHEDGTVENIRSRIRRDKAMDLLVQPAGAAEAEPAAKDDTAPQG